MGKVYKISRAGIRLFYKIRHHRGHGIHSPFVYNFVTRVVEEKLPYYDYHRIKEVVQAHPNLNKKVDKYDLLSFRLANEFMPQRILELGTGEGINALCLTSPVSKSLCICIEESTQISYAKELFEGWNRNIKLYDEFYPLHEKIDCVYINLKNFPVNFEWVNQYIIPFLHKESFVVIKGIRTKREYNVLWKNLVEVPQVSLALDMYNIGILFFRDRLHKQLFRISF